MEKYLMTNYKGRYRVLCELDESTNDFPRDADGNIDDGVGLYIPCKYDGKIYAYGRDGKYMQLCAYIPSLKRGHNIIKQMKKLGIEYHNADETDSEVTFLFPSTEIDKVAELVGAKTYGANISPFSTRNLPKTKVEIPSEQMQEYKKITSRLGKNDMLLIKNANSGFLNEVLAKKLKEKGKRKPFDYRSDQKKLGLTRDTKGYIYTKGLFDEYLDYLYKKVDEYLKDKEYGYVQV